MSQVVKLYAADISCQHCAMAIQRGLAAVQGISAVQVDVPNKTITLTVADGEALTHAQAALEEIGYPAKVA